MKKKLFTILFIITGLVIAFFATRQTNEEAEAYKDHLENTYNWKISHQKENAYWCGYAAATLEVCTSFSSTDGMAKCAEKADEIKIKMGIECKQVDPVSSKERHQYLL